MAGENLRVGMTRVGLLASMPPTGLADGFGQEVPYERIWGPAQRFTPKKWVPGSAERGLGGRAPW
ncbi:hypothetical protein GCM10023074_11480 [Microbispora amethystogenes]